MSVLWCRTVEFIMWKSPVCHSVTKDEKSRISRSKVPVLLISRCKVSNSAYLYRKGSKAWSCQLQCVAVRWRVLAWCVVVRCSALQCVAVCREPVSWYRHICVCMWIMCVSRLCHVACALCVRVCVCACVVFVCEKIWWSRSLSACVSVMRGCMNPFISV